MKTISGETVVIPAQGILYERIQVCAKQVEPLRRAVEEAFGATDFRVRKETCQKLLAKNDQIPHADDYCPGELFVIIHLGDSQTSTYGIPFRQSSLDK